MAPHESLTPTPWLPTPTLLQALQQLLVVAAAGAILALGLQPVLRPKAAGVLTVPQKGLVVQLQVAEGLALLLGLQRAELQAGGQAGVSVAAGRPTPHQPGVLSGATVP